jgi:hypothetical protein
MFDQRLRRLDWLATAKGPAVERLRNFLFGPLPSVIDYLENGLRLATELLGFDIPMVRSSTLGIQASLRGQDRVIAIAAARGATHYVNSPGGRALYEPGSFQQAGIELQFLAPYQGRYFQFLPSLMTEDPRALRDDIIANCRLETT